MTRIRRWQRPVVAALGVALPAGLLVAACGPPEEKTVPPQQQQSTGSPDRGRELIASYGCASCHTVPGVKGADGLVGPPLNRLERRSYIAGVLPNDSADLQHWIMDPQSVVPGNAMPDLGVSDQDARDIVAYLYTLK